MKRIFLAFVVCALAATAQNTPRMSSVAKHIFRLGGRLTEGGGGAPQQVAMDYLRQLAPAYGLTADDLAAVYVAREYRTGHNGVTHLLFRQKFDGVAVENAEWTANVDREGRLINVGGRLYPRPPQSLTLPGAGQSISAVRAAAGAVNPRLAAGYSPFAKAASDRKVTYASDGFGADLEGVASWYAVNGKVYPVWRFHVVDTDGRHGYEVMVESRSQKVLAKRPATLFFDDAPQPPRGLVYNVNPQPDAQPGVLSTTPPPVMDRVLRSFAGDPTASPKGWLTGTETAGNNVVAGINPSAIECVSGVSTCLVRPVTTVSANQDFSFPLQLGASAPAPSAFPDAAVTNAFYWVNRAHDLHYALGFDEAAGNFQEDNFGKAGVGGDAVYVYAQEGSAARGGAVLDNSDFGTLGISGIEQDGTRPRMGLFITRMGGIFTDPDLDAQVILHEYTHGVSGRLVPELYDTEQGASMGEAWSDFFALEFTTPEGAPPGGGYDYGAYFTQSFGYGIRTLPYSTDFNINPLSYADLGHVIFEPEAHSDGQIWVEALWQVRSALIQQFGEQEGRRRVKLLAIDSMKLSPPAPSMVDARDAFLLADQVDFDGASQTQLWAAFAKRGLGALAQSDDGNSIHISPSFDVPSNTGALGFYESSYVIGEQVRLVLADANLTAPVAHIQLTSSSGDLENLDLRRNGQVYTGTIATGYAPVFRGDSVLELAPSDSISAYYVDFNTGAGTKLIQKNVPTYPDYTMTLDAPSQFQFSGEKALGLQGDPATAIEQALPFAFPFFGRKYTSVWVYNNGILTFDLPDFSPCGDASSLAMLQAVAPMWMMLRTNGAAQSKEDVYLSQTDNSVTFRWAAETAPDIDLLSAPSAVNFSATLFSDGRIEYRYGSGNRDLVSGSQFFGCPASAPTVGISNGHRTFTQLVATHDSQGNLSNAFTVDLQSGFVPHGGAFVNLESPADGDTAQGLLIGKGTVYDSEPDNLIRRVDVIVDGLARAPATLGVNRSDFCATNSANGCPYVGFTFTISTAFEGIGAGKHTLQVRATNSAGVTTVSPDRPITFTVQGTDSAPYASIDSPTDGSTVSGSVPVTGYFALPDARIVSVDVILDGLSYGSALYGSNRSSVCAMLPGSPPNCPRIGFSFTLNSAAQNQTGAILVQNGPHALQVRATDAYGRTFNFPAKPLAITVNNADHQKPVAAITGPTANQTVGGTMHVSGYAYSPQGSIRSVYLIVDGRLYTSAPVTTGTARPDICATLQNVTSCPNIGFDADLDTTQLPNGPHTLDVLVTDNSGVTTYAPSITGGLLFTVQN